MDPLDNKYIRNLLFLFLDLSFVLVCLPVSLLLRLDFDYQNPFFTHLLPSYYLGCFLCYLAAFGFFKSYRLQIKMASLFTALRFCAATFAGASLFFVTSNLFIENSVPRSIFIIQALLIVPLSLGFKFSSRIIDRLFRKKNSGMRTLIYGCGEIADRFLPMLLKFQDEYEVVGLIDETNSRRGYEVQGIKIIGSSKDLEKIITTQKIEQVILALPDLPGAKTRELARLLYSHDVVFKRLPSPEVFFSSYNSVDQIVQDLQIEDLLRRSTRKCDLKDVQKVIHGKTVLVTGGGGSIGSELVRQLAEMNPAELIINDSSEYALYTINNEIKKKFPNLRITPSLGNMADEVVCARVFESNNIDIVFHACAYKHVPLAEGNVVSVVRNNILSAKNVFDFAGANKVGRVILISTDKAVLPTNVMGATKRICELLLLREAEKHKDCIYSCVRFGNVLGSSGSVIPKFIEQIKAGGPITITHPEMTRFFMLIPEAVSLVLQTLQHNTSRETFILNMGEPVKINDLAIDLLQCFGRKLNRDIEIKFVGLRPGEKLFEELKLSHEEELIVSKDMSKVVSPMLLGHSFDNQIIDLMEKSKLESDDSLRTMLFSILTGFDGPDKKSSHSVADSNFFEFLPPAVNNTPTANVSESKN